MIGSISSGWSMTIRKNSASLRSCSAARLMNFSRSDVLRRKFSSTRSACSSCDWTWGGSSPRSPSASRSASVNAVPLFSVGSRSSATPRGNHAGTLVSQPLLRDCFVCHHRSPPVSRSDCLGHHLDRAARALGHADAAALAVVVVELEALARPELDHRVVGADAVAVVALEAVAAGQAAARLEQRVGLVEAARRPRRTSTCGATMSSSGRTVFGASL